MDKDLLETQKNICEKFHAQFIECDFSLKVGISKNVKDGARPINGLRINPEGDTCGWYIWGGEEWSDSPDFFVPLHASHLEQWAPLVLPYLGLPPGWRFLIAEGYQDVWWDTQLLK